MDREDANTAKRELCEKLLGLGTVMLVIESRRDDVTVPAHLSGDPKLRLNIDHRFGAPMTVDDWGVQATLSFDGVDFDCILPWEAIYVLFSHSSGQPYVFPDDVPNEVLDEIGVEANNGVTRPALRLVSDEPAEPSRAPEEANDPRPAPAPLPAIIQADPAPERQPEHELAPDHDLPPPDDPPPEPRGRPRGHLRVVK